jgi:hypothetical protein
VAFTPWLEEGVKEGGGGTNFPAAWLHFGRDEHGSDRSLLHRGVENSPSSKLLVLASSVKILGG